MSAKRQAAVRARLEEMYRSHHASVWRTLRRRGYPPEAAADLTQQAFLIAVERCDDIEVGSERAFLLGTALRLGHSSYRVARRTQLEEDMDLRSLSTPKSDELTDQRRALALLDRVLLELDVEAADVFCLYELEGLSMAEISQLFQVPPGTVASRLRRAREAFRDAAARLERQLKQVRP